MSSRQVLVTGGGGFLGGAIVRRLIERGDRVRSFSRGDYPELRRTGVEIVRGELSSADEVAVAATGCDVIFHVAAKAGVWGPYRDYYTTNYLGTINVLKAQRRHGVPKLIYTSSPSVVFDGRDMSGVDEGVPYARTFKAAYPRTKALAEQAVLQQNNPESATIALRPHLIWGPDDNHLVPRIIARAGRLRRIGHADPLIDCTYIDNAAEAHLLAADRLAPGAPCAGRIYFISNGEPRPLWSIVNGILAAAGLPPVTRRVPRALATIMAPAVEHFHRLLLPGSEPRLTRFLLAELTREHWFDISAARRDLAYEPKIGIDEGMHRLRDWLRSNDIRRN